MDGTLVDTEPYWIEAEFDLADKFGGTWSREHAMNLVGHDLLDSGRYIREHMGIDLEPSVIVEELLDRVIEHIEREVPVASRGRRAAVGPEPRRRAVRAGHDVLQAVRRADPGRASRRARSRSVVTGDAVSPGQAAPGALPQGGAQPGRGRPATASPSRTPTPVPGPPWRRAAPCSSYPTTCRCCRGSGRVFRDSPGRRVDLRSRL